MAIVIPSKNTYDRHNPKVRDNVIERIEVGAVEVKNSVKTNINVHTENIENFIEIEGNSDNKSTIFTELPESALYYIGGVYVYAKAFYADISIQIPKLINNAYISNIYSKKGDNGISNIQYTLTYTIKRGNASAKLTQTDTQKFSVSNLNYSYTETSLPIKGNIDLIAEAEYVLPSTQKAVVLLELKNEETIDTKNIVDENDEYYSFSCKVIVGKEIIKLGGCNTQSDRPNRYFNTDYGECERYEASQIDVSFNGNTIGIDLTDKTLYINGETQKKVHSIEGNELMQTENYTINSFDKNLQFLIDIVENDNGYRTFSLVARLNEPKPYEITVTTDARVYLSSGVYNDYPKTFVFAKGETEKRVFVITEEQSLNVDSVTPTNIKIKEFALEKMYSDTQTQYANGKETATIRCSISDYYDYDSGDKIISIDNFTGKMSFVIGDIVVPMVFGVDGNDRPMSLYNNGNPKKFQVLGKKMFYDGAVWQELSLQEV